MDQTADREIKREYVERWLTGHTEHQFLLTGQGAVVDLAAGLRGVADLVAQQGATEYVYVLAEGQSAGLIPAYIGKSRQPVTRWRSHLNKLLKQEGLYLNWSKRLLVDGQVGHDLFLWVVGDQQVKFPPIPDFPTSIGSVEYQLIGLIQDAYAMKLLNHEGQAR